MIAATIPVVWCAIVVVAVIIVVCVGYDVNICHDGAVVYVDVHVGVCVYHEDIVGYIVDVDSVFGGLCCCCLTLLLFVMLRVALLLLPSLLFCCFRCLSCRGCYHSL